MKIINLRLQNINSLAGEHFIDFSRFEEEGIFAITGETGSGKTTILDAISLALYGRTPRIKNDIGEVMSKWSGSCSADCEFEVAGVRCKASFLLRRAHNRPSGKLQPKKMLLSSGGKIIEERTSLVPKKIEELTGLDFERFTKSVMLAQGKFDAFLKAKENEKAALLEQMTDTAIYGKISQRVYEKSKEKEQEALLLERRKIFLRSSKRKKELQIVLKRLQKLHALLEKEFEALQKEHNLAIRAKDLKKKLVQIQQELANLEKVEPLQGRLKLYQEAKEKEHLYREWQSQLRRQKDLEKRQKEIKEAIEKIVAEQKELELSKKEKEWQEFIKAFEIKRNYWIEQEHRAKELEELEENIIKELHPFATLQELLHKIENIDIGKIEQDIAILQDTIRKLLDAINKNPFDFQKLESLRNKKEERVKEKEKIAKKIDEIIKREEKERKLLLSNQELEKIEKEMRSLQQDLQKQKDILDILKKQELLELQIQKYDEDRKLLKEGEPCPLCGSLEHPFAKSHIEVDPQTTAAKRKEQEKLIEGLREKLQNLKEKRARIEEEIKFSSQQIASFCNEPLANNEKRKEELKKEIFFLEKEIAKQEQQQRQKDMDQKALEKAQLAIADKKERLGELIHEKELLSLQRKRIEPLLSKKDALIKRYDNRWKEKKKEEEKKREKLQEEIDKARKRAQELFGKKERLEGELESIGKELERLQVREKEKIFFENLPWSLDEFLSFLAIDGDALKERVDTLVKKRTSLEAMLTTLSKEYNSLQDKEFKDDALKKTKTRKNRVLALITRVEDLLKEEEKKAKEEAKRAAQYQNISKELKLYQKLNNLIGSASGDKLRKIAQQYTLDNLIILANEHLAKLQDRYMLQRGEEFDLLVVDNFQAGAVRPVATLSGGESFLVSMALALGLSDLVSHKIHIQTLFLDEGFGTLDEETLESVLSALNTLHHHGKLIGIISHVEALKERIPQQIHIKKLHRGSSILEIIP